MDSDIMSDEIDQQQAMILLERAYRHQMKGELADAIILYERSLATWPTAEAWTFLGWTYSMNNRYDEAIECCHKAIEVDPTFGNPYNEIGAYLIELDRWEEAIQVSQREVQLSPDAVAMVADAGEILYYAGRLEQARTMYERSLELAPEGRSFGPYFTMQLALLRRNAGEEDGAQAVAQLARKEYSERRAAGEVGWGQDIVEAMLAAFDHDPDGAIEALQRAVRHGLRWPMLLEDPQFDLLHEDQRFIALREEIDDLLTVEHEKILQLICFDNPVPDDWQPMPETCEGMEILQD